MKIIALLVGIFGVLLVVFVNIVSNPLNIKAIAKNIEKQCQDVREKDTCYADAFSYFAKRNKLEVTLAVLTALQKEDSVAEGCHFIAHVIAAEEIKKAPNRWEEVLSEIPITGCTGGFLMGVIEQRKVDDRQFMLSSKTMQSICRSLRVKVDNPESELTCLHTMGHLMLVEKKGEIATAIYECELLAWQFQYECVSGVFMENLFRRNLIAHGVSKRLDWNEAERKAQQELCLQYSSTAGMGCWREISHMFIVLENKNPEKVYKHCFKAPEKAMQRVCSLHAAEIILLTAKLSLKEREALCTPVKDQNFYETCKNMEVTSFEETMVE